MRFALSSDHREYFAVNKHIEFEDLLSKEEATELSIALDKALAKRMHSSLEKLEYQTVEDLYLHGRDLWKEDPLIKKNLLRSTLSELASSLLKKRPLRLAYDQYIRTGDRPKSFFAKDFSIKEISCFTEIKGALILKLSDTDVSLPSNVFCPLPQKVGSGLFISSELPLSLTSLLEIPHLKLYMIVFCQERAQYILEKNDPLTHALKKEGYAFGDSLKNDRHPLVQR